MGALLLKGFISSFILHLCKSQVTETPLVVDLTLLVEQKITEPGADTTTQPNEVEGKDLTPAPGDTYVPPQSQGSVIASVCEESNTLGEETGKETNDFTESVTSNDDLDPDHAENVPAVDSLVEEAPEAPSVPVLDETGNSNELGEEESDDTGDESWRIGAISAVGSLALGAVIAIYCIKFRKRTVRPAAPVKLSEDSEAAETIHGESNENTLTGGEGLSNQNVARESLDLTVSKKEENLSDFPPDLPTEAVSSQDLPQYVRNDML